MSPFGDPEPKAATPLPADLRAQIEASTEQFEARFGAMAFMARANGWISDYRNELIRIARIARGEQ